MCRGINSQLFCLVARRRGRKSQMSPLSTGWNCPGTVVMSFHQSSEMQMSCIFPAADKMLQPSCQPNVCFFFLGPSFLQVFTSDEEPWRMELSGANWDTGRIKEFYLLDDWSTADWKAQIKNLTPCAPKWRSAVWVSPDAQWFSDLYDRFTLCAINNAEHTITGSFRKVVSPPRSAPVVTEPWSRLLPTTPVSSQSRSTRLA